MKEEKFLDNWSWTGEIVGLKHNYKISNNELAEELGITPEYVSMVLHGAKKPAKAEEQFRAAIAAIAERRKDN